MKLRTSIAAAGAAALVGTGAFALPAALASPAITTHTLKFIAVQKKMVIFTRTTFASQETDVNKAGKVIGFDMLYVVFKPKSNTGTANVTVDTKGGFLYAVAKLSGSPTIHGKVTGGTGAFKHATGTVTAKSLNKAGTKHAVTIVYHT